MRNRRRIAFIVFILYIFTYAAPLPAVYAAQTNSALAAAQAATDALSIAGQAAQSTLQNQTSVNPQVTVVQESPTPESTASTDISTQVVSYDKQSQRLDPRETISNDMSDNLKDEIERFGAGFFAKPHANTLEYAPVGPNYIIAPGDEIKVNIWGYDEIRANLIVNRDGGIMLPQAGALTVAGMTFDEARSAIKKAYGRLMTDFDMNVAMGKLHTITVYVTGRAVNPGAYAVSSMATLVDVLSQAGGPSLSGTMRRIEVKRRGKKVALFDVYRLLLHGDRKGDIRLADGDIIFIPSVGPLVTVAGNVKSPATYELTYDTAKLNDVINLAGGTTSGAYKGRIQIVRVKDSKYRTAFESDISSAEALSQKIQGGDLLKVFAVPADEFNVIVSGDVMQPGSYAVDPKGTSLSDIIKRAGGLKYTASTEGELTRIEPSINGPVTTRTMINLKDVMNGKVRVILKRNDYFFVRAIPDWDTYRSASISGRVLYPGAYAVKRGERLSSLIERAGGYADGAFLRGTVFMRESVRVEQQKNIDMMVERLEREAMASANEAISTATTTNQLTFAQASVTQKQHYIDSIKKLKATGRVVVQLPRDLKDFKGSPSDIELHEGDQIYIPDSPGTVQVIGSIMTPTAFVYRPGVTYSEYIKMAGGYSSTANAKKTYIMKADGSILLAKKAPVIEEGDFIVVPERVAFTPSMRNTTDMMDILYKMAVGIASVHYIFK
jgi:polysaccharide export outer membrane protein